MALHCPLNFPTYASFTHGYKLTEISRAVGLHDATISHIINAMEGRRRTRCDSLTFLQTVGPIWRDYKTVCRCE